MNNGVPLNLDWIDGVRVNTSAVERRTTTLTARRTVKKDWQVAWLLRAITCMDLTTLSGDDTEERVRRLCAKARQPIQQELVEKLGIEELKLHVGAVCVYHALVETAVEALNGSGIPVAAVSTGFPAGLNPFDQRLEEVHASVAAGATVDGSVLFDEASVGEGAVVRDSIVGRGAVIDAGAVLTGAVVGDGALVGPGNELAQGIRIWPGVRLEPTSVRFSTDV